MSTPRTILVVDDEVHIVNIVVLNLKRAGHRVLVARDPVEAFEIARRERPALVITDHNMPNGTGMDLCKLLKGTEETADIPVILLTAYDFSVVQEGLKDSSICAVIPKPFSPRELMARTDVILQAAERE